MKELRQNKEFRTFCWQLLDVIVAFWITYLSWLEWDYQTLALGIGIPVLTLISKRINKALWDLWVEDKKE
jgi:hypothetical protein